MATETKQSKPIQAADEAKEAAPGKAQLKEQPAKPAKKPLPGLGNARFKRLLVHTVAYGSALVLILGLGFFYYRLVINANQLEQQNRQIAAQLEQTASANQRELSQLKQELESLRQSQVSAAEQVSTLAAGSTDTDAKIRSIQEQLGGEELWRLQLSRVLYLAEQQRILGGRVEAINYLLLEAEQLLLSAPGADTEVAQLNQLTRRDLSRYASLADIDTELIFRDLRTLEQLIGRLEFKQIFYQGELGAADGADDAEGPNEGLPYYRRMLEGFYREFAQYIRISRGSEADLDFSRHNRDLILSTINLQLNQAKHSLLKGEANIYYTIIGDTKKLVIASFRDSNDRDTVIDLLDELSAADIIPEELPALDSYDYFFDN